MTTITPCNNGTALFFVAIINPDGAVPHGNYARLGLADLADALNSDQPHHHYLRYFATQQERDYFIANHNKEDEE